MYFPRMSYSKIISEYVLDIFSKDVLNIFSTDVTNTFPMNVLKIHVLSYDV